jgi:ABC-type Na+ transport system ATPase subunit NatA
VVGKLLWRVVLILGIAALFVPPLLLCHYATGLFGGGGYLGHPCSIGDLFLAQGIIVAWGLLLAGFSLWVSTKTKRTVTTLAVLTITLLGFLVLTPMLLGLFGRYGVWRLDDSPLSQLGSLLMHINPLDGVSQIVDTVYHTENLWIANRLVRFLPFVYLGGALPVSSGRGRRCGGWKSRECGRRAGRKGDKTMLEVNNLRKTYGALVAVEGISLSLGPGDIFGFIGPNGAGKTSTIKMISTLLRPTSGTATIDGIDVVKYPREVRSLIGYMPDAFGVYDDIKVWEYLDFFAAAYRQSKTERTETVDRVLELTDLTEKRDTFVQGLSRGMQQRLCLAKCLVHDPKVLLLDEPASGLDPRARIAIKS